MVQTNEVVDSPLGGTNDNGAARTGRLLFDAAFEPSERQRTSDQTSSGTEDPNAPKQWTVAIDLTAAADFGSTAGAPNQLARIRELAEQTRGSSVNLVVQIAEPAEDPEAHRLPSSKGGTMPGRDLHRYVIANGEIKELPTVPSEGFANDVQSLLELAGQNAPSERLALIMQSHGGGTEGLQGSTGSATMPQFVDAVRNGLRATGRDKLDLIDFDACSMGSTSVLQQMSQVATDMVASAEEESSARNAEYDAQNLQLSLSRLLQNPSITGAQFGGDMVRQADEGANDGFNSERGEQGSGTVTLAHFDLRHVQEFDDRLSNLGHAIAEAARDPHNQAAIDAAIDTAPVLPRDGFSSGLPNSYRDLKSFVDNISNAVDNGSITDVDGSLRRSIDSFRQAQAQIEPEYHGDSKDGYDQMGGLNAFLPAVEFLDPHRDSGNGNSLAHIYDATDDKNTFAVFENQETIVENLNRSLEEIKTALGSTHAEGIQQITDAIGNVTRANNEQDFRAAMLNLHNVAQQLQKNTFGDDFNTTVNRRKRDQAIADEHLPEIPGWQELIEVLRSNHDHPHQ